MLVRGPISTSPKVGTLRSKQHWKKVTSYIKVGIDRSTKVIAGVDNHTDLLNELHYNF
jgi:hypothetical protein